MKKTLIVTVLILITLFSVSASFSARIEEKAFCAFDMREETTIPFRTCAGGETALLLSMGKDDLCFVMGPSFIFTTSSLEFEGISLKPYLSTGCSIGFDVRKERVLYSTLLKISDNRFYGSFNRFLTFGLEFESLLTVSEHKGSSLLLGPTLSITRRPDSTVLRGGLSLTMKVGR